jgi:NitT/TauT family transport system permease protein
VSDDVSVWFCVAVLGALAVYSVRRLAAAGGRRLWMRHATPVALGLWILAFWQILTQAFDVPRVLLPSPGMIWTSLLEHWSVLADDFSQTVLHAVLAGFALGSGLGFCAGILVDRSDFLRRGLLPLAALAGTVPLVGVAPIMVMWFGFDWPSKAAVAVVMTFFPMFVNTIAGLGAAGSMELDLMRSYAAGYWRTLIALRLPAALPFVFNGLKVNSTLALIGAIIAEFFGSPTVGMGFRISTEAARLNMALVWATIFVAAVTGSVFYGLLTWLERRATFWHPSQRLP